MSLDFGTNADNRYIETTTLGSWNWGAVGGTIIAWIFPANDRTGSEFPVICSKSNADNTPYANFNLEWSDNNELQFAIVGTPDLMLVSNTNPITIGAWNYAVVVWNPGGVDTDQKLYHGSLASIVSECGYTDQDVGASLAASTNEEFKMGAARSDGTGSGEFDGLIAVVGVWNTQLTLSQLVTQQFQQKPVVAHANLVAWHILGYQGAATLTDLSGNGHNGSVFAGGLTVGDHVPLGPPFGFDNRIHVRPTVISDYYDGSNRPVFRVRQEAT